MDAAFASKRGRLSQLRACNEKMRAVLTLVAASEADRACVADRRERDIADGEAAQAALLLASNLGHALRDIDALNDDQTGFDTAYRARWGRLVQQGSCDLADLPSVMRARVERNCAEIEELRAIETSVSESSYSDYTDSRSTSACSDEDEELDEEGDEEWTDDDATSDESGDEA